MLNGFMGAVLMAINAQADLPIDEPINKIYAIALRIILALIGLVMLFKFAKHLFSSQQDWVALGWEVASIVLIIIGIIYGPDLVKSIIPGLPA